MYPRSSECPEDLGRPSLCPRRHLGIVSWRRRRHGRARAEITLYRFRICSMEEIHEKLRPRVCDRYLVILLRNFKPFSISFSFYSFVDLFLIYLAISLFPEASGEEKNRCVGPHARARADLASAQVQYPWMSVDLVTHIIVKRGLNSNPSRAAGRAYRTIPRCPIFSLPPEVLLSSGDRSPRKFPRRKRHKRRRRSRKAE